MRMSCMIDDEVLMLADLTRWGETAAGYADLARWGESAAAGADLAMQYFSGTY